jgi:parvulin-like peptidyl-prolyl isomerase
MTPPRSTDPRPARALLPAALLSLAFTLPAAAEIIERVVAKVGSQILTLSEFESRQIAAVQAARVGPEGVERFLRENNQRILQEAVDDLLLLDRAIELGLRVRTDAVDETIEEMKRENNLTTDEAFQAQLRREGMTLDELRRSIARSFARRMVLSREIDTRATVTEAEVLAEFQAHKEDYAQPATARLAEIVLEGEGAQERAAEILQQVRAGADFAALAKQHSRAATAGDGGDLGRVVREDLAPELAGLVFSLPVGGVSDPLPTAAGWRLLRVVERTEAKPPSLETARPIIEQRLAQGRVAQQYEKYIEGLRKNAGAVEVRVREVPLQVEVPAGPTLAAPAVGAAPPGVPGADSDEEIVASPQDKPERVAPEPPPGAAAPQPEPSAPPPPGA